MSVKIIAPIRQGQPRSIRRARAAARFSVWFLACVIIGVGAAPLLLIAIPAYVVFEIRRRRKTRRITAETGLSRDEQIAERLKTAKGYVMWG